ncbi:MAG: ribosome biogenesis GTPase Der [Phycisphaerales bacterium]|nr:MAG: ribosome biogenesis GTPase Der [Phycisphaerales bacterium]
MGLPLVAIVGRPNVGKSSLLNCLAKRRISIVDPTAGVTRDRVSTVIEAEGGYFELVDTGGYGVEDRDDLTEHIETQIRYAVEQAVLVLFVVDVRAGVTPLDVRVAELLREKRSSVILIANKADDEKHDPAAGEFYRLGFAEPLCVSALHGRGKHELLKRIFETVGEVETERPAEAVMKLAIVGRRNVGKSTLVNALAAGPRTIVSEVPGTTRDAIDVEFERSGEKFTAIDTAGLRKRAKLADDVEFYAYARAVRSVRRSDVVLFMIDAAEPVSQVDKKLGGQIAELSKPCILVVNKWDLAKGRASTEEYGEYLTKTIPELDYAPIAFMTARDGRNVESTVDLAKHLYKQAQMRVSTSALNRILREIMALRGPSVKRGGGVPKMYYASQIAVGPPTIMVSVNDPSLFGNEYRRFLLNRFRERLPYAEVPIRLLLRARRPARTKERPAGPRSVEEP